MYMFMYICSIKINDMKDLNKILVGGQALRNLGSDRYTNDVDYLINDATTKQSFICSQNVDYLNANGNKLFAEIQQQMMVKAKEKNIFCQ